ncbi:hypothetical protein SAMN02910289_00265 [Lachnospiraceae bacterium RM5]|nr:hypothetical protein SAMN02910289_00265 [Lachnospiraceae bacterium RM5]
MKKNIFITAISILIILVVIIVIWQKNDNITSKISDKKESSNRTREVIFDNESGDICSITDDKMASDIIDGFDKLEKGDLEYKVDSELSGGIFLRVWIVENEEVIHELYYVNQALVVDGTYYGHDAKGFNEIFNICRECYDNEKYKKVAQPKQDEDVYSGEKYQKIIDGEIY